MEGFRVEFDKEKDKLWVYVDLSDWRMDPLDGLMFLPMKFYPHHPSLAVGTDWKGHFVCDLSPFPTDIKHKIARRVIKWTAREVFG